MKFKPSQKLMAIVLLTFMAISSSPVRWLQIAIWLARVTIILLFVLTFNDVKKLEERLENSGLDVKVNEDGNN